MISRFKQWWRQGPGRGDILGINRRNLDLVFADYRPGKFRELDDKLAAKKVMEAAGVPVPRTLGEVSSQADWSTLDTLLADCESLVLKPSNGFGGKGILILHRKEGHWTRSGGVRISSDEIKRHVGDIMSGIYSLDEEPDAAICEELIIPHPFFAELGPEGLCDLRIVLENHKPLQAMCRVPTTASDGKANLHGGGVGLGVDLADGRVNGAIVNDRRISHHPDTGQLLLDLYLPDWEQCVALAVVASHTVDVQYMGVDIVVDRERGPLILEINARPGLAIQIANAQGQPAVTRAPASRLDRATSWFNWLLMLAMAVSPLWYHWWQNQFSEALVVDVGSHETRSALVADQETVDNVLDRSDAIPLEEISLAESSQVFRAAREAGDKGDFPQALDLYRSVLADSSLAPFALNNMAILARRSGQDSLALIYITEAVTRFPTYHRGLFNMGLALTEAGQLERAREAYVRSLELKPNHAPTWAALGNLEFSRKAYDEAVVSFRKSVRFDPTIIGSRFKLGLSYRLLHDLPAAQTSFKELLALDPSHEGGVYWLGRTYRDQALATTGNRTRFLDQAQALLDGYSRPTPRINSLLGTLAFERGDLPAAFKEFDRLAQRKYRAGYHNLVLAVTALELGNWNKALSAAQAGRRHDSTVASRLVYLAELGRAVADSDLPPLDPGQAPGPIPRLMAALLAEDHKLIGATLAELENALGSADISWAKWLVGRDDQQDHTRALNLLGAVRPFTVTASDLDSCLEPTPKISLTYCLYLGYMAADRADNTADALLVLKTLRRVQPDFLPVLRRDFTQALATGEQQQALDLGKMVLALGEEDPHFIVDLAELNLAGGKPRAARRHLRALSPESRQTPEAIILESRLAMAADENSSAIKLLNGLLDRDPANLEAHFVLGEARLAKGDFKQAEQEIRKALDLAPARQDIRQVLARLLMKRSKYVEAIREWSVLLSLEPDDLSARFNYALSLQRSGDNAAALQEYDAVLAADPDRSSAVFNRGLALEKLGRTTDARAAFRHMLQLVPDHTPSLRKLETLEGARP